MAPRTDRLPSALAIPISDYLAESHPVLRLHRLCDAVEILTRFCTIAALGEYRVRHGDDALPPDLVMQLQDHVEKPTLGRWAAMLRALVEGLDRGAPLVLPELPDFATRLLLPLLPGRDDLTAYESLLRLRNDLAHGGGMTRTAADGYLRHWEPRLEPLWQALAFLEGADVCQFDGTAARRLTGSTPLLGPERALSTDLRKALGDRALTGHVVLLRDDRWLDLWPLCHYARAVVHTPRESRPASADSPMVYYRAGGQRLTYLALGSDWPFGDGPPSAAEGFRRLFQLDRRAPREQHQSLDFDDELRADAAALIGRKAELDQAVALLKDARTGVFWIAGRGGIGKSFLMAALCHAPKLRQEPRKALVVGWRFKASDQNRGNRTAFFRHAVTRVAEWLGQPDVTPSADPADQYGQLGKLLDAAAARTAPDPCGRPPRVLFFLDGLDEIDRLDPTFADVPFLLSRSNVVWVCSGRPEGRLPEVFRADRCTPVFGADGLPAMSDADIRGLLVDETGALKYDLLRADREEAAGIVNDVLRAVTERAGGLPLYVHFVIEDVLSGHFRFADLPHRLPRSLAAYYEDLLNRLAISDRAALLTPLLVTIAWAKAPLDEETLFWLLVEDGVLFADDEESRALLREGLAALQSMIRLAPVPGGGLGYEPYHETFRAHLRADEARHLVHENRKARRRLERLAREWGKAPANHPARRYALRYGPQTLLDHERPEDAAALLLDLPFLEAKTEAGLVFDLADDFAQAVAALPEAHHSREHLRLIEEALRRDMHFIARHPSALFQCLWNSCWWYDCPESAEPYEPRREPPATGLYHLLGQWRAAKERATPGFVWVRSLRPPQVHLGTAQRAVLTGHESEVNCVAFAPDGKRLASASHDRTVRLWDPASGRELACLRGHEANVYCVAFAPDGGRLASASWDGTVRLWDTASGAELARLRWEEGGANRVTFLPDGGGLASGSKDGTVRVWDTFSGREVACLRGHEGGTTCVAFAPDGGRLAWGANDGTVSLWEAPSGRELACLRGHRQRVSSVAFAPDGGRLVSGSKDCTVRLWEAASGRELACLDGHESGTTDVAFSPEGRRLASASHDGTVRLWDAFSGRERACLRGHGGGVHTVAFAPGGGRLASASWDGTVRLWDAASGNCLEVIQGQCDVSALAAGTSLSPLRAVSRTLETTIQATRTGQPVAWFRAGFISPTTHPNGRLWAGSVGNHVCLVTLEGNPPGAG